MAVEQPDMKISIGSLRLRNPVMTASGTFGYGEEYGSLVNLHRLGAIIVKGISLLPRQGTPPPRIAETACGMLNAIGLENVGLESFLSEKLPFLQGINTPLIVNILGDTVQDYQQLAARLDEEEKVAALEVNISCPNVKQGGVAFGTDPGMAHAVTKGVRQHFSRPVIVKLSPNVTDITGIARAAEEAGADAVSLINTVLGMAIDIKSCQPKLANIFGGLSGPAIKPIGLRMVWQVAECVSIPIIGIGGITTTEDAIEYILAGACAVQVGTTNFINPRATEEIIQGIGAFLVENKMASIQDLIGRARQV
ncbi:MAG: dihydroorotate dehydrogenase [Desulfobulbaceae bacterium]|jgi:dihydroorotate dehydrogenase (NAD+) catalytic subunit|nr:dihydroorotate dehydrogenase [Desulfobulbaceae bacterium]MDH3781441.1 dihydroorotate dehydrogenase [Desulfobulbaceae bacterium]MDH3997168.1 dihydroorotate dehydrogenase [Desulfobulbaceae bacterium]